jgi:beta-barrel assembly-enhancing protease
VPRAGSTSAIKVPAEKLDLYSSLPTPPKRNFADQEIDVLNQRATGYGLVRMPEFETYLNTLYQRIKVFANVASWPGSVYVLANSSLEAYVTEAGNVYLSYSWIASMESEDELVALLSHEFSHVFLHFHRLGNALDTAHMATNWVVLGVALTKKISLESSWSPMHNIALASMAGASLAGTAWARDQEASADLLGLKISLGLGYSFEHGFKAFLERIIVWDDEQHEAAVKAAAKAELLINTNREKALAEKQKQLPSTIEKELARFDRFVTDLVTDIPKKVLGSANSFGSALVASHPDSTKRLEYLVEAVTAIPSEKAFKAATVVPFKRAVSQSQTAQILANYTIAASVMANPSAPNALAQASKAASAPTSLHALPLSALFRVMQALSKVGKLPNSSDIGLLLESNMASKEHRTWSSFIERSTHLIATGRQAAADNVMAKGFDIFGAAGIVWPQVVSMLMSMNRTTDAKRFAADCGRIFPMYKDICFQNSQTDYEKAAIDQQTKQKVDGFLGRRLKLK